jgi:hypothetical protein
VNANLVDFLVEFCDAVLVDLLPQRRFVRKRVEQILRAELFHLPFEPAEFGGARSETMPGVAELLATSFEFPRHGGRGVMW